MPQLEFIDCPRCGKRVASSAKTCHHCERMRNKTVSVVDDRDAEAHHAANFGGYDASQDDFDYDEFLSEEFPEKNRGFLNRDRWKYVSILLLVVFAFLFLVQLL